jgi:hypothetical protein
MVWAEGLHKPEIVGGLVYVIGTDRMIILGLYLGLAHCWERA